LAYLAALIVALMPLALAAQRVVVFPLHQEAGPPSASWIGTGLAVALDEALTRGGVLNIPLENLVRLYDQEGLVRDPAFSIPSLVALSRQMGAGVLIEGEFRTDETSVTARLTALDVADNVKILGKWEQTQGLTELPELTRKLGEGIFTALGREWIAPPTVSPQAFESYIRGRISQDPTLQEVYFKKALEIQPDYSDAKCHLAIVLKETGRVTDAAKLLTELEEQVYPKAYLGLATLAEIRMDQGRITEAQKLLMRSLKAAESPEAHIGLATWYLKQKKFKEASTELLMAEKFGTHQDDIDYFRHQIQAETEKAAKQGEASKPETPAPSAAPAAQPSAAAPTESGKPVQPESTPPPPPQEPNKSP
jgi:tetratricopeptide (TPR) repeat protein